MYHHDQHFLEPSHTQRQHQGCDNSVVNLAILFSLTTMELLENDLQSHSGETPLFLMRTEPLALLQRCHSIDADASCKQARILQTKSSKGFHPVGIEDLL